jgi:hypothetical protein
LPRETYGQVWPCLPAIAFAIAAQAKAGAARKTCVVTAAMGGVELARRPS